MRAPATVYDGAFLGPLFTSQAIGNLVIKNRFVRPATSESMASHDGGVTDALVNLHSRLAEGGVGLQILGHAYVDPVGQYHSNQTGIYSDSFVPGLKRLTESVHIRGGRIFAQLAHAGSQTRARPTEAVAPSPVMNPLTGNIPRELADNEVWEVVKHFGESARRAKDASFDGIHLHGANGYLISEFSSPYSNRRTDAWGGDETKRSRFLIEVHREVRRRVGSDFPITLKLGVEDAVPGGLKTEESVRRAVSLESEGLNAIEVSCGVMKSPTDSAKKYVALDTRRAFSDLLLHRVFRPGPSEAYFAPYAAAMKKKLASMPIILVGGLRSVEQMSSIVRNGVADFVALARPLIREPDLVSQILQTGRRGKVDCTSCNLCLEFEGQFELTCWRKSKRLLAKALYNKIVE
jgi:2,4-dienoyl-CoA reductase-like NADH-dependent reductase (Old Yellow Enzyme family)